MTRERMKRLARIWNATPPDRRFHAGGTLAVRLDDGGPVRPLLSLTDEELEREDSTSRNRCGRCRPGRSDRLHDPDEAR